MLMRIFLIVLGVLLLGFGRGEGAITSMEEIVFWVGSGENQAALVIDWNDGIEPQSLAWGFRWDGVASGYDMFNAVAAADPALTLSLLSFGEGFAVDGISYSSAWLQHDEQSEGFTTGFWSYWLADGMEELPSEGQWSGASTGFEQRELSNNSWDGWSWSSDTVSWLSTPPIAPVAAPIPEPSYLPLLVLAGSGWILVGWRRLAVVRRLSRSGYFAGRR